MSSAPLFSPYPWLASLAFSFLWIGFFLRHVRRDFHVLAMCLGIAIDLSLVLVLEFTKDAVATAMALKLDPWQQVHIYASTVAVLLYIPVFVLGWIRWRMPDSNPALREWHRRLGYCALAFRTVGYVFMYSMLGRP